MINRYVNYSVIWRLFFYLSFVASLYSCNDNIVTPIQPHHEIWTEILIVDSSGNQNSSGNFIIKNVLEFFDSTYKYTSFTVSLLDSTNITSDPFSIYHEGLYKYRADTLSLFTLDKIHISILKTSRTDGTLWMGGISQCSRIENSSIYFCRALKGEFMNSFLWEKLKYKNIALFIKSI